MTENNYESSIKHISGNIPKELVDYLDQIVKNDLKTTNRTQALIKVIAEHRDLLKGD